MIRTLLNARRSDRELIGVTILSSIVLYLFLGSTLVVTINMVSMLSRTNSVRFLAQWLFEKTPYLTLWSQRNTKIGNRQFQDLRPFFQEAVLSAIKSLQNYRKSCERQVERNFRLFARMSLKQQWLCKEAGYVKKLELIELSIKSNQEFLNVVANNALDRYGLKDTSSGSLNFGAHSDNSSHFRVIEVLGHIARDWTSFGSDEVEPLMDYIIKSLNKCIPNEERSLTAIVIPGSGLGRLAHEVALATSGGLKFKDIYAAECSGLMHVCNDFIYSSTESYTIQPFVHSNSNFYNNSQQFRKLSINSQLKPDNLHLIYDDFRNFELPDSSLYRNVVVVTAFFLDTAENLMDYLDKIEKLTTPSVKNKARKGYWINIGPLKYGTAAQVELNAEELAYVRRKKGWKDLSHSLSLMEPSKPGNDGLVGYITNKESMWQGYYGLEMWASQKKKT